MSTFVLTLSDPNATLETVGGKGMSLARMARAGLPVPGGFHVTTEAYRCFVASNNLQPLILAALSGLKGPADQAEPDRLEAVSQQIGQYFARGKVPGDVAAEILAAYAGLSRQVATGNLESSSLKQQALPVAVRSSATAEDLPGASFAGQQDTYLNIGGAEDVLAAVKKCWASLWTARAIAYLARQAIDPDAVALAVVVQELVFADAAGVLFTVNPITGKRGEMMITATWGLGEALVGGMVTPDTLVIDKASGRVVSRETSQKQVMTVRMEKGTREQSVPGRLQKAPVLSDRQAAALVEWGQEIERLMRIKLMF